MSYIRLRANNQKILRLIAYVHSTQKSEHSGIALLRLIKHDHVTSLFYDEQARTWYLRTQKVAQGKGHQRVILPPNQQWGNSDLLQGSAHIPPNKIPRGS